MPFGLFLAKEGIDENFAYFAFKALSRHWDSSLAANLLLGLSNSKQPLPRESNTRDIHDHELFTQAQGFNGPCAWEN